MNEVRYHISTLDIKGEKDDLLEEDVEELHSLSSKLFSLSHIHNSMLWHKSRINWLKEGNDNRHFFDGLMSSGKRINSLLTMLRWEK